ncbi:MAG TPA: lipopolysaccharide biosynthesis protein, partial [Naasia sp.]
MARAASRSAVVTLAGQLSRVVIQFAGVIVLARLLEPQDYGLVAMVLVIIGVGEVFRDFGLSTAAVQAKTLSDDERNNLFWINGGIGLLLAVVAAAVSPLVALLFDDERLVGLTLVLSVTFLLNGIGTQFRADLNRDLRFGPLVVTDIAAQVAGVLAGVLAAVAGWGYWALAGQQIVLAVVMLVGVAVFARWRPSWYRRAVPVRRFLTFGAEVVGAQLLGYASKNIDTLVIGTTLGATPLGYYNRAYQLLALPLSQINAPATRVALPVLSKLQSDRHRFGDYLLAGQTAMLHLVLALFSISGALAVPLVTTVLGEK